MKMFLTKKNSDQELMLEEQLVDLEEKLSTLIGKASDTRKAIQEKLTLLRLHRGEVSANGKDTVKESKLALDTAWEGFSQLWNELELRRQKKILEYDAFFCDSCRKYVYDEALGDPSKCIAPHTCVSSLPSTWRCPVCGAPKEQLRASTMVDGYVED